MYVGVVAQLLQLDLAVVEGSVRKQFAKKQKVFDLNFGAVKAGYRLRADNVHQTGPVLPRDHERDGGQDHHRRQRRMRHGRGVCGRYGGCVVSHYTLHFAY